MQKKAPTKISIPGFSYRGFDVPALDMSIALIDNLNTSKPAYKLAPVSTPLAWRVGLYSAGRDIALGVEDTAKLPEPVRKAGTLVYEDAQKRQRRGGWHKDGVLYMKRTETPKGMRQPKDEAYVLARYFKDIAGFEEKDGAWTIKPSPKTRETLLWIPEGGGAFVVPTIDGVYNPVTGTAFETIKDRDAAIKRWVETGLTEEQAMKELSRNYRNISGVSAVFSYSGGYVGPLSFDLNGELWYGGLDIGLFPASRLHLTG